MYIHCIMKYQWDPKKSESNKKKHGVYFSDAATIFSDPFLLYNEDDSQKEKRFRALGMDACFRILVVVFTWRGDDIRIISARKATPRERKQYEDKP